MSETTHTPLPWKMAERFVEDFVIRGANDAAVAYVIGRTSHVRLDPEANMRLIVTAVNHHAELVEALKEMREACAAACRVIATHGDEAIREFRAEAAAAGVANGFGKRAGDLLARIKEGDQ